MKYELMRESGKGVLIDRTPILRDVRDTFEVSFLLPEKEMGYIALFTSADGIEYRKFVKNGQCKIPKELLTKEQYVGLIVSEIDNEHITQSWECEPLKISAFLAMRQSQWQVSGGMTDEDVYNRIISLERLYAQTLADVAALKTAASQHRNETAQLVAEFKLELYKRSEALASLQNDYAALVGTVKAINGNQAILQDNIKRLSATVESLK